jgi:Transcription factor WhiB
MAFGAGRCPGALAVSVPPGTEFGRQPDEIYRKRWPGRVRVNGRTLYRVTQPSGESTLMWGPSLELKRFSDRKDWRVSPVMESEYEGPETEPGWSFPQVDLRWHEKAACAPYPSKDPWFPTAPDGRDLDPGEYEGLGTVGQAICLNCPVRERCLKHALLNNEEYGIWGGLTPLQRANMKPDDKRRILADY